MIIELLDGTRYDIENYNIKRLFHNIPSANLTNTSYDIPGRGNIITDSYYENRVISVELLYITQDIFDYYLMRSQMNELFLRNEPFYLIFKREPYKRWLVRNNGGFEIPAHPYMNSFTIEFITQKWYAESVGTSLDLQNRKEWDVNLWSYGMGIDWDTEYFYQFNTNNFNVINIGNTLIDGREQQLNINIQGSFNDNLTITNNTTGDTYIYNARLLPTDNLNIRGIRTFKNNVSEFANTNKKFLTLAPGNNEIVVTGGTISNIEFDFRFLYK